MKPPATIHKGGDTTDQCWALEEASARRSEKRRREERRVLPQFVNVGD
jgi:hypothetical protein